MFAAFGFGGGGSTFSATYRVYPVSFLEKESAERGDKLILPPSALDRLGEKFFQCFFCSLLLCLHLPRLGLSGSSNRAPFSRRGEDELFISEERERKKRRGRERKKE